MKRFRNTLIFGLAITLMLVAAAPALAAPRVNTVDIALLNKTGSSTNVRLNGTGDTQDVFVAAGSTVKVSLVRGEVYSFRYTACGHSNSGTITANAGASLTLKKCGGVTLVKIAVNNKTGNAFVLTMTGNGVLYGFWIPPQGTNISVQAGGYQFTSTACGSPSGVIKATARASSPLIWTWSCKGTNAGATISPK